MSPDAREVVEIRGQHDISRVRRVIARLLADASARPTETTKFVTAASELARNTLMHGGGGTVTVETARDQRGLGVLATFEDRGPGIPDIEAALRDGYTTGTGLGLGLGGAKRLCDAFDIQSSETGTRVRIESRIGRR